MRIKLLLSSFTICVAPCAGLALGEKAPTPSLEQAQVMLEEAFLGSPSESRRDTLTITAMHCVEPISNGEVVPCHVEFEVTSIYLNMPDINHMIKTGADLDFQYDVYGKYGFRLHDAKTQMCDEFGNKCKAF